MQGHAAVLNISTALLAMAHQITAVMFNKLEQVLLLTVPDLSTTNQSC